MIGVYALSSTGSNWVARILRQASQAVYGAHFQFVVEPWSPNARPREWRENNEYHREMRTLLHLLGRWDGRNDRLGDSEVTAVMRALELFEEHWPRAAGFKTLLWPYPEVWREYWGDRLVTINVVRSLEGILCTTVRRGRWRWFAQDPWWYSDDVLGTDDPLALPWNAQAEQFIYEGVVSERLRPLLRAACYYRYHRNWRARHLPAPDMVISYEAITAEWDYWIPYLLEQCGLPIPSRRWLATIAAPRPKNWPQNTPFSRNDIVTVIEVTDVLNDEEGTVCSSFRRVTA